MSLSTEIFFSTFGMAVVVDERKVLLTGNFVRVLALAEVEGETKAVTVVTANTHNSAA